MEQAQLAREVARGHGWVTQCVRPGAWQQMLDARPAELDLKRLPDTSSAPLSALLLAPVLSVLGVAMVTMTWSRLNPRARGFWPLWGHGVVLLALSTLPLVVSLPDTLRSGLAFRGRLLPWPPYAADRVQRVGALMEDKEIVMADASWFPSWYADVMSVWMPTRRPDLALNQEAAEKAGHPVAGVVVSPSQCESGVDGVFAQRALVRLDGHGFARAEHGF